MRRGVLAVMLVGCDKPRATEKGAARVMPAEAYSCCHAGHDGGADDAEN